MGCCISFTSSGKPTKPNTPRLKRPSPSAAQVEEEEEEAVKEVVLVASDQTQSNTNGEYPNPKQAEADPDPAASYPHDSSDKHIKEPQVISSIDSVSNPDISQKQQEDESEEADMISGLSEVDSVSVSFSVGGGDSLISTTTISTKQEEVEDGEEGDSVKGFKKPPNSAVKGTTTGRSLSRGRNAQSRTNKIKSSTAKRSPTAPKKMATNGRNAILKPAGAQGVVGRRGGGPTAVARSGRGGDAAGPGVGRRRRPETAVRRDAIGVVNGRIPPGSSSVEVEDKRRVVEVAKEETPAGAGASKPASESLENPLVSLECFIFL